MEWWRKVLVLPVKRALVAVAARVRSRKDGSGILKLHNDVQTCEYQDVQVMWEILQQSEMISSHSSNNTNIFKGKQPFGRVSVWLGRGSSRRSH
ncbi:hypothetical protein ACMD2_27241 [Ananas comosus]|uniref:Uncharacterized protein n=1 Tax=Ananas comosus TaxID=4615 RepID=A0A199V1Q2_ANACO|nr:hypothetical protein ACMD2_27241 [Ananas comosus]